ncbi:MAG: hypothetical protein DBY24_08085 [Prevotellaceae bacterium]|nr:MAG: hypothetical protein DBY24_08085 [Prevotellaceae bacterium]
MVILFANINFFARFRASARRFIHLYKHDSVMKGFIALDTQQFCFFDVVCRFSKKTQGML